MGYTMKKSAILILAASSIISSSAGVQAATVTETYNFSLSNFVDISGNNIAAPYNSVTGSFTLTFDPAVAYADQTVGLTVNSFVGGPVASAFGFSTYLGTPYALSVGGVNGTTGYIYYGTNDFALQLRFPDAASLGSPSMPVCTDPGYTCGGNPTFFASGYTLSAYANSAWFPTTESVSVAETPLPAAFPLFATGLGGFGLLSWRRKRKAAAIAA